VIATINLAQLRLNGEDFIDAVSHSMIHDLLGPPTRVIVPGPPAPYGHRNNQVHVYDSLGTQRSSILPNTPSV
jgi:hypothetical protein